jgi:hypothetical protein
MLEVVSIKYYSVFRHSQLFYAYGDYVNRFRTTLKESKQGNPYSSNIIMVNVLRIRIQLDIDNKIGHNYIVSIGIDIFILFI